MKKQNPTNKLAFNKAAVTELNVNQMQDINGGASTTTIGTSGTIVIITLLRD